MAPNVFSWEGKKVFIPPVIIRGIIEKTIRMDISVLEKSLEGREPGKEDFSSMNKLKPIGEKLSDIVSCLSGNVQVLGGGETIILSNPGNKTQVVLHPSRRKKDEYFIANLLVAKSSSGMPSWGFPATRYNIVNKKVGQFMDGFFSAGMRKLTQPIDAAISEWRTISEIEGATGHARYFIFGYLLRKALYEGTVKYRREGRAILWRGV